MALTTFSTGLSGLATNSQGLNVVGNNIANLNTVGFKSSNITFTDVLGQISGTANGSMHVGLGSQVGSVRANFNAGSVATTNRGLDVAIQGKGFLVVSDDGVRTYTRNGSLAVTNDGRLVAENGANVQGYVRNPVTGEIETNQGLSNITLPSGVGSPIRTSEFMMTMNLDAEVANGTNFTAPLVVYDSVGQAHNATVSLQKEISGGATPVTRWRFDITIPRNEVAGIPATNTERLSLITGAVATAVPAAGTLLFDDQGRLSSAYLGADPATPPALANLTVTGAGVTYPPLANGAVLSPAINWTLVDDMGNANVTAFASPNEVTASTQNGSSAGSLSNVAIEADGTISAVFSNGQSMNVARLALAQFANVDGLTPQGAGFFAETNASGSSFIGVPGEGGRGRLASGALEQSNVDLATELTKIITFQRGYQASARLITLTDQIMQETMNLRQ